ncbi:MAG: SCP2 sterol-binding domain-containing protein [Actinobacteria bacterium]|nr:SCP2 sterol-binding domain-containing protein [Actinomycetota bacterium]
MPRFLSSEWIAQAHTTAQASATLADATADVQITIQQNVTDTPRGDVHYVIRVDHGRVEIAEGVDDQATVSFTQDWETGVGMSNGSLSAQDAFTAGRLRVGGNIQAMMDVQQAFTELDDVFVELRLTTTY